MDSGLIRQHLHHDIAGFERAGNRRPFDLHRNLLSAVKSAPSITYHFSELAVTLILFVRQTATDS
ncbi:hypothetical protein SDC9_197443 [bioreactor metagenome]|uniref:Uncharacterized protein n=1 Tax=bioreactor metagenome TaxID=1076179 RepID=A0A645IES4_9ZZZZ